MKMDKYYLEIIESYKVIVEAQAKLIDQLQRNQTPQYIKPIIGGGLGKATLCNA